MSEKPGASSGADMTAYWERLPETQARVDFRRHRIELNQKLRAAFMAGTEERSLRQRGRGLTADELRTVMTEYPGDLPTQQACEE
jgi:hypothetical protein